MTESLDHFQTLHDTCALLARAVLQLGFEFFGFLLQDHGWGGNYNRFGRDGFLEKIMVASKAYPHFILTVYDSPYDGYAKVEWAEPAGSRGRSLFYRKDIGCKPPNTEQQAKGNRT